MCTCTRADENFQPLGDKLLYRAMTIRGPSNERGWNRGSKPEERDMDQWYKWFAEDSKVDHAVKGTVVRDMIDFDAQDESWWMAMLGTIDRG